MDVEHLRMLRENVRRFMRECGQMFNHPGLRVLDIAPQIHEGARPYFASSVRIETLDLDPAAGATYTGDICQYNAFLPDGTFDAIVCTEVLEHTLQPFAAVTELKRLLRPGGHLLLSVPFHRQNHFL